VNIMHDLLFLELAALAELIRTRAISPVEITVHQLDRSRARRPNRMIRSLATALSHCEIKIVVRLPSLRFQVAATASRRLCQSNLRVVCAAL
jgi:hypothetical protein